MRTICQDKARRSNFPHFAIRAVAGKNPESPENTDLLCLPSREYVSEESMQHRKTRKLHKTRTAKTEKMLRRMIGLKITLLKCRPLTLATRSILRIDCWEQTQTF